MPSGPPETASSTDSKKPKPIYGKRKQAKNKEPGDTPPLPPPTAAAAAESGKSVLADEDTEIAQEDEDEEMEGEDAEKGLAGEEVEAEAEAEADDDWEDAVDDWDSADVTVSVGGCLLCVVRFCCLPCLWEQ